MYLESCYTSLKYSSQKLEVYTVSEIMAATYYGLSHMKLAHEDSHAPPPKPNDWLYVFDLGGNTSEVCIMHFDEESERWHPLIVRGNPLLGGQNVTLMLFKFLKESAVDLDLRTYFRLYNEMDGLKQALSECEELTDDVVSSKFGQRSAQFRRSFNVFTAKEFIDMCARGVHSGGGGLPEAPNRLGGNSYA